MDEKLKQSIAEAISSTGFPLEHSICNILKKHSWNIISNRYYIDDVKGSEREIDIIAYKNTRIVDDVEYITALVISCKKSEHNRWCFLTRDADKASGNINWTPLHFCSTDERLGHILETQNKQLFSQYLSNRALLHLYSFDRQVFTFQEVQNSKKQQDKGKGNLCVKSNDNIYNSIITPIKAISAEKKSRIEKYSNQSKRCYLFYAISIFEGEMIEVYFDCDGKQNIEEIKNIKYLNRHIVNNVDDFYIVDFNTNENFDYRLNLYDILHTENTKYLTKMLKDFYVDIFDHPERVRLLWKEFELKVSTVTRCNVEEKTGLMINHNNYALRYDYQKEPQCLTIDISYDNRLSDSQWEALNNSRILKSMYRYKLKDYFSYTGKFEFGRIYPCLT